MTVKRVQYTYSIRPAVGMTYFPQWGMDQRDAIEILRSYNDSPLSAIYVAPESQIEQCWIGGQGWQDPMHLVGYRNPLFGMPDGKGSLWARPYQFFGSTVDSLPAIYYDAPQGCIANPYSITNAFVQANRGQIYGRSGGHICLTAYYGDDYPRGFPSRREPFQRDQHYTVANGNLPPADSVAPAAVYGTVFRNIITGRDAWEVSSMLVAGAGDAFLLWRIYGCTEEKGVVASRVLLASGTGTAALSYQGSRGYDAIEIDAARNNTAGGTGIFALRFTARDW